MMDKKNIDELFREKLKTFRETPDEKVWTTIENSLDKKRKKRVVHLWWALGGVAAVLAIALFVSYPFGDTVDEVPAVTDTENNTINGSEQALPDTANPDSNASERDNRNTDDGDSKEGAIPFPSTADDAIVNESGDVQSKNPNDNGNTDAVAASQSDIPEKTDSIGSEALVTGGADTLRKTDAIDRDINKNNRDGIAVSQKSTGIKSGKENNRIAQNDLVGPKNNARNKQVAQNDAAFKKNSKADEELPPNGIASNKKSTVNKENQKTNELYDKTEQDEIVAGDGETSNVKDQTGDKDTDGKKSIFEALNERPEKEEVAEESRSRWSAGPSVAPVYFNAMGEGSPIDPGFSPNPKSGNTNFSYGLSVAYAVSDKLSLRSGIHKADYGYDTNNVGFSPTLQASANGGLQNVDFGGGQNNLSVSDAVTNPASPNSLAPEFSSLNSARDGTVAQNFGYLEIPLELDYALVDRKFGVNLVGGISSLFLLDNSVTLTSDELTAEIGEANNLNDLNFSTNIGFGINYKFTPKVQLNIEPVFKYQLNTFSNTSGNFRPYTIGVYSGLNFRF